MNFQSILFNDIEANTVIETSAPPGFFVDLNLDQFIDAVTAFRQEYNLKPFFYTPLNHIDTIQYRQEIMQDIEDTALNEHFQSFAQKMVIVRRYLGLIEKLDFKNFREGWFLEAAQVYCEAVESLALDLGDADLKSPGLLALREYVSTYASSDGFKLLLDDTRELKAALSTVSYCVIFKGLRVRVRKYEGETDYTIEVEKLFEKFKQGAAKDYRSKLNMESNMNHVEAHILDCVAQLYPEIFASLDRFCMDHRNFLDETIRRFDREIQFYLAYLEYIAGLKQSGLFFCYPQVSSTDKEVFDEQGFDLALAKKCISENKPIVVNDFYLEGKERIFVVSGPNQGGKTTFARTFGQLHYLASLGLPVQGKQAKLYLFDNIYTHFEKEENIKNLRGKLQDDLVRIHEILAHATPNSIIIMNEIFTSTTLKDAVFLSKEIMEKIIQLDLLCVFVTFIDELASLSEKTVSMVSTVYPDNPALRTFKIIRKPADGLAYALSIAEKYRLTYSYLKERIRL
jgi:DNA mismatch repair protein MutS